MLKWVVSKVFGTRNERVLKKLWPTVHRVNEIYETYRTLSDEDLLKKTEEFTRRLADGEPDMEVLPEAYALVKEAARRLVGKKWQVTGQPYEWDMVHYDVQVLGAIVLHQGKIAEMATGEGKTLVATMPLYLNALMGRARGLRGEEMFLVDGTPRGITHLVTVNDYLARRDREWMGPLYESLGLTVDVIQAGMNPEERRRAYGADITYGTNNEFGFDYLRDHMVFYKDQKVQRGHVYAIVDEIDSILIDEARTPLIISGPVERSNVEHYREMKPYVERVAQAQKRLVHKLLDEAEKLLASGEKMEAARKLLQVRKGHPKSKRLFKMLQEPDMLRLVDKVELDYMRDKKMHELEAELYFVVDEKGHTVELTDKGREYLQRLDKRLEDLFDIPDIAVVVEEIDQREDLSPTEKFAEKERVFQEYTRKMDYNHAIKQLLKAYMLYERDVEYVVQDGQVIIVDEFTGRLMPGRRWSDGLHEAVEAKEGVRIQEETQTLATITLQNYFRMYEKLAGMTGTAATEAQEFWEIYKLDVVVIPTNRPVRRIDYPDIIFRTKKEKYQAVIDEIIRWHKLGRPILVGTTSIEVSEILSRMLRARRIPHQVLNAKHHEKEAQIVAKAGQRGAVTIATNMAGRGTDIKLGPGVLDPYDPEKVREVLASIEEDPTRMWQDAIKRGGIPPYDENDKSTWGYYGLYVIGTERHESRRIDNQLRGRAGRQGDPGASRFFVSLEDDLLRLFGSDRVMELMDRWGRDEGPQESRAATWAIENAQKRVEMHHFQIRKRLLEYDDVMNRQREVIYEMRDELIEGGSFRDVIWGYIEEIVDERIEALFATDLPFEEWPWDEFRRGLALEFLTDFHAVKPTRDREALREAVLAVIRKAYEEREKAFGKEKMREMERYVLLSVLDRAWREHLYELDHLRTWVFFRAYAQKDPVVEYKQESFRMFEALMRRIRDESIQTLFRIPLPQVTLPVSRRLRERMVAFKPSVQEEPAPAGAPAGAPGTPQPAPSQTPRLSRAQRRALRRQNRRRTVRRRGEVEFE